MTDTHLVASQVDPRDILGEVDHPTFLRTASDRPGISSMTLAL